MKPTDSLGEQNVAIVEAGKLNRKTLRHCPEHSVNWKTITNQAKSDKNASLFFFVEFYSLQVKG